VEDLIGDEELSGELRQRVSDMPFASQQYLLKCLKGRNANVVDVIPVVSAALGCNVCAYALGTLEQARAAMTYIVKYIVKDPIEVMAALVLIQKARIKAIRFGSIADDSGTDMRKSMNHIMKMVNMFTAAKEVPATLATTVLSGRERFVTNLAHCDVNVTGAVNFVKAKFFGDDGAYDVVYDDEPLSDNEGSAEVAGSGQEKEGNDDEEEASSDGISVADGSLCDQEDENEAVADARWRLLHPTPHRTRMARQPCIRGSMGRRQ